MQTRLERELRAGDTVVVTIEDLDQVLQWVFAFRKRFFHLSGIVETNGKMLVWCPKCSSYTGVKLERN